MLLLNKSRLNGGRVKDVANSAAVNVSVSPLRIVEAVFINRNFLDIYECLRSNS